MNRKLMGILAVGTLCSAVMLQTAVAQDDDNDNGFTRPARGAFGQHGPQQRPERQGPGGMHNPRNMHEGAPPLQDADGDGLISEAEFIDARLAKIDDHFTRMDQDGDGQISMDEQTPPERLARPGRPERPEIDRDAVAACVRETIADYVPELDDDMEARFDNVDANGDGDGYLSLAEISAAMSTRAGELFTRIDTDADGFLSSEELAAHHAEQVNLRRVVRACIGEQVDQG